MSESENRQTGNHGLANIVINVIAPVIVLRSLSSRIGPLWALLIALSLPISKGLYDIVKLRRTNYFSVLGVLNVAVTGSLALFGLGGMWFSIKEAAFPLLVGMFVLFSSFGRHPFIKTMLVNPQVMRLDEIHAKLEAQGAWPHFERVLRISTQLLAGTFLVSAIVNFIIATYIFIPIDTALDSAARATMLNKQIASMTLWAWIVIIIPSIAMLTGILWYLLRGIRQATGLSNEQILKS